VLLVIINDILDIASIEEGKIGINLESTDLKRMFRELENNLSFKARQKKVDLRMELSPELPERVLTDQTRLFQILMNLVSNAIKFTEKGHVKLICDVLKSEEKGVQLRFKVIDTGIGIPVEQQASIFESFNQGGKEIQRTYGGTGLGLTITRRLLQLFDSEIKLKSMPGIGSEFSFDMHFDLASNQAATPKTALKQPEKDLEGLTLLYVEDNEMNQKVMALLLSRAKVQLDFAFNGKEALELLRDHTYDGVLMDFHMPVMDGLSCSRAIRSGNHPVQNKDIPIIGITADVFEESAHEGMLSGMNTTIKKPINKRELFNAIESLCRKN
jgi:CheY-like chemotaxis protein/two-component sensor histidine kinase